MTIQTNIKNKPRIAIVEDDRDLLKNTEDYLLASGYPVWGVGSAEAFYKRYLVDPVELVILDIGLPGEDGISVAQHLRELPQLTVIIVSARSAVDDRLAGLRAGADRYLVKPVDFAELVANIETIDRRPPVAERHQEEVLSTQTGLWQLETQDWQLIDPNGKLLALTPHEFALLNCLFKAKGEIVPKKMIADKIMGTRVAASWQRLDVMLTRLRKKGLLAFGHNLPIKTVPQVGYAFTAPMME